MLLALLDAIQATAAAETSGGHSSGATSTGLKPKPDADFNVNLLLWDVRVTL